MRDYYPSPISDVSVKDNEPHETTAELIERISSTFVHIIDEHDFDFASPKAQEVMSHIMPDWVAQLQSFENGNRTLSLNEQRVIWRDRAKEHPETRYGIDCVFSEVREDARSATVFVSMWVSGIAEATLYNMNECYWRNVKGKWMWIGTKGIRANPLSSGGLG
ncbi:hypothetical protein Slin15195_G101080 [Septoria linicola]|uniref:Uncharacterized protein n=1 Tax=Septoria linicola TaxID=215465 RepID=A0A9Q9ENN5_9PEZI|nr:hypothetical protein Slin14017_G064100 [Septoria linicola]USW56789.1 hypothetical protein Slin15195_G101080 [Septoria linicola]